MLNSKQLGEMEQSISVYIELLATASRQMFFTCVNKGFKDDQAFTLARDFAAHMNVGLFTSRKGE